jgi:hypothetical protein
MEAKAIYALIEKLKKEGADAPTIFRQVRKLHEAYSAPSTKDLEKLEAKRNAAAAKRTFPSAPTSEKPTLMEQLIQARKNLGRRTPPLPEYHISSNYVPDHL